MNALAIAVAAATSLAAVVACRSTRPVVSAPPAAPTVDAPAALPVPEVELPAGAAVLLVVDRSGSMQGAKLEAARAAMAAAIAAMPDGAPFGVIAFDSSASEPVVLAAVGDRSTLGAAIAGIEAGGGTDLVAAMRVAHARLRTAPGPVRHIVLLSDGESAYDGVEELVTGLAADGISVSAVAIGDADLQLLRLISDGTRGRLYANVELGTLPAIYVREVEHTLAAR